MIFLGADHRGFELKEKLFQYLVDRGYKVTDLGNDHLDPNDDYVDFAKKVAETVVTEQENRGILLCGSGVGVDIVANKVTGVRSALVDDLKSTIQSREHEDVNVIALPADKLDIEQVTEMVEAFLNTPFSKEERHERRLEKLEDVEEKYS